jgi:heme-degrading monooxygenase HmoA
LGADGLRPAPLASVGPFRTAPQQERVDITVIKINAITVPGDSGDELARRFAARAGAVDGQEGFEGFELLKPTDERLTWLVITRWKDEESFQAWVNSPAFGHGHQGASAPHSQHGGPVSVSSELWSYEVTTGSTG